MKEIPQNEDFYEFYKTLPVSFRKFVRHKQKKHICDQEARYTFILACLDAAQRHRFYDIYDQIITYIQGGKESAARNLRAMRYIRDYNFSIHDL